MKKLKYVFGGIIFVFIFFPLIILFNPELFKYKFFFLTIMGIFIYFFLLITGAKNIELGITKKNFLLSIKRNMPIIIFGILIIIILKLLGVNRFILNENKFFVLFYIFISCPIQEFLYRGVFGYFDLKIINNSTLVTLISSICYSFVHIIYKDLFTCLITFVIGIIWYHLYRKDSNLVGVSLCHSTLGILTIFLGIID